MGISPVPPAIPSHPVADRVDRDRTTVAHDQAASAPFSEELSANSLVCSRTHSVEQQLSECFPPSPESGLSPETTGLTERLRVLKAMPDRDPKRVARARQQFAAHQCCSAEELAMALANWQPPMPTTNGVSNDRLD